MYLFSRIDFGLEGIDKLIADNPLNTKTNLLQVKYSLKRIEKFFNFNAEHCRLTMFIKNENQTFEFPMKLKTKYFFSEIITCNFEEKNLFEIIEVYFKIEYLENSFWDSRFGFNYAVEPFKEVLYENENDEYTLKYTVDKNFKIISVCQKLFDSILGNDVQTILPVDEKLNES